MRGGARAAAEGLRRTRQVQDAGGDLTALLAIVCCVWLVLPPTSNWRDVRLTLITAAVGIVLYFIFRGRSGASPAGGAATVTQPMMSSAAVRR